MVFKTAAIDHSATSPVGIKTAAKRHACRAFLPRLVRLLAGSGARLTSIRLSPFSPGLVLSFAEKLRSASGTKTVAQDHAGRMLLPAHLSPLPRVESVRTVAEIQGLYGPFSFPEKLLQKIWLRFAPNAR